MGTTGQKEDKELEAIKKDEKVQRALSETSVVAQKESPEVVQKQVPFLGITAIVFLSCGALYFLLGWKRLPIFQLLKKFY